jgi:cell division protein ZapA (FtsZ GTPase activity inhibitor)
MKNSITLSILGQKLAIRSAEDEGYVRTVESYLEEKIEEVRNSTKAVATLDLALLTALNVTGELIKAKETLRAIETRTAELKATIEKRLK